MCHAYEVHLEDSITNKWKKGIQTSIKPYITFNWKRKTYQAWMVDKTSNPALPGCINNMFFIYPKEVASTLVLKFSSRLILTFSFISHTEPHDLTNILHHLQRRIRKRFRVLNPFTITRKDFWNLWHENKSNHCTTWNELRCVETKSMYAWLVHYQIFPTFWLFIPSILFLQVIEKATH